MTPFVVFPDGAQAELLFTFGGRDIENRFWFLNRQPPTTATQLQALADGLADWYSGQLLPFLGNDLLFRGAMARDWSGSSPGTPFLAVRSELGGSASASLSANVTVRVVLKGSSAQTWPNNSSNVPGIPEDVVSGNTFSPEFQDAVFEAYVALIDLASGFGPFPAWRWVIASSVFAGVLRPNLAIARMDFVRFRGRVVAPRRRRVAP